MTDDLSPAEQGKRAAALAALDWVEDGMKLGLGTGSTAKWFVDLLAEHLAETGKKIVAVPTSSRTKAQAEGLGIPLSTLGDLGLLDLTVDGADEFDPALNLIKGAGGALLQEKIVASASDKMVVITDPSKEVATLGAFALPVEVIRFGWQSTIAAVADVLEPADVDSREIAMRMDGDDFYVTDEGHYIA
ncbi:MAG: ribose-5-phosphate isomerase RpiA, partial [Pseudomonadota bacterium]